MTSLLPRVFGMALLATGCAPGGLVWLGGDSGAEDSPGGGTLEDTGEGRPPDKQDISIQTVSPPYGTSAGGTVVTLTGGPFDSSAQVSFADQTAQVSSVSGDTITCRTPTYGSEALVNVTVETDDGWGRSMEAFTYFQDGAGVQGSLGIFQWLAYDGAYFAEYTELVDFGFAYTTLIVPQAYDYASFFAPGFDQCASSYSGGGASVYVYTLDVSSIRLESAGGTSLALPWVEDDLYFTDEDVAESSFRRFASYDLQPISSATLPGLAVEDYLHTPYELDITAPAINGSAINSLGAGDLTFRWQVEGPGDFVTIELYMLNAAGDDLQYEISCLASDDGSFTVPTSVWPAYPSDRGVWVYSTRWQSPSGILPSNASTSGMVGAHTQMSYFVSR